MAKHKDGELPNQTRQRPTIFGGQRDRKLKIVCICPIGSRIFVFPQNRLRILWFFDSKFFGATRQINGLGDSRLIGPDRRLQPVGHFHIRDKLAVF